MYVVRSMWTCDNVIMFICERGMPSTGICVHHHINCIYLPQPFENFKSCNLCKGYTKAVYHTLLVNDLKSIIDSFLTKPLFLHVMSRVNYVHAYIFDQINIQYKYTKYDILIGLINYSCEND